MNQQPQQVQIKASDQDLKGVYSNMMQVAHTQEEFVLDFFNLTPGSPVGVLSARVMLSPGHFKRLIGALGTNLANYEKTFGEIKTSEPQHPEMGFQVNQ